MISFLLGNASTTVGEVLGTDISMGMLSAKADKMPLKELILHLKNSGYEHLIGITTKDHLTAFDPEAENPDLNIKIGRLYSLEKDLHEILHGQQVCTLGKNYLLIEADKDAPSSHLEDAVFLLQVKGYTPVLMQAELYGHLQDNYRNIKRLLERGCLLQMDMLSLTGYLGTAAKRLAHKLIHDNYVSFIGSGVTTPEEHKKCHTLLHSRRLAKLLRAAGIRNRELMFEV
ncbi:hypothetical protein GCM10023231_11680 [Olivibacter ginsenosidimutans]|uniref:protein-tyrosine-phosphatase n=1 Tax=Olivibacter ginsenosidimutans TaxID=1176537 RepID=A0ABP9AS16_9SPHI